MIRWARNLSSLGWHQAGIDRFFKSHRCNNLCRLIGLAKPVPSEPCSRLRLSQLGKSRVFKAHRRLYHSTLGWRVIKKKKRLCKSRRRDTLCRLIGLATR